MGSAADREVEGGRVFLQAEWRWLLMLNYVVPGEILLPLAPAGTVLDLFEGRAMVSVVGFRFLGTKVLGVGVPLHRDFEEVNLRFYVRREMADGERRRGVVFVRELVPRRAIALVARAAYNEPYLAVRMRSEAPRGESERPGRVEYAWRVGKGWESLSATAAGEPAYVRKGSEEEFITEHYWGYTRQRDGGTVEYRVEHPSWRVWGCEGARLSAGAADFYGEKFAGVLKGEMRSVFLAEGSGVGVYRPMRLELE